MGQTADELRSDIEQRRENMSGTVNAIEDRVMPGRIIERRKRAAKGWMTGTRERVMGSSSGDKPVRERVSDATEDLTVGARHLAENVSDAPAQILDQTRGAPLIAGGVALGIGVLIALVVPESEPERRVAQSLEPQIAAATDAAKEAGQEALEKAKSATQDAVGELKDAAGEHVQEVADQAKDAAESVAATARAEAEPGRD